jgi:hypothetical protein
MHRHLQFLAVLAALAAPCGIAQAQTLNAAKVTSIIEAADSFVALAKDSHKTGRVPRQTDAAAKPLLDTVLNTKEIEGGKPLPWSDLKALDDWNRAAAKVGLVYYLAGTGVTDLAGLSKDPQAIVKANQNAVEFAPEFGRYSDTQIRIHSALIDAAQAQVADSTPEQRKDATFRAALSDISSGTAQAMTGLLGSMVLDGMSDDWLLSRVVVLLEVTPKAARFLAPDDRERVKFSAAEVADYLKNPDVKSGVNAIARAFAML